MPSWGPPGCSDFVEPLSALADVVATAAGGCDDRADFCPCDFSWAAATMGANTIAHATAPASTCSPVLFHVFDSGPSVFMSSLLQRNSSEIHVQNPLDSGPSRKTDYDGDVHGLIGDNRGWSREKSEGKCVRNRVAKGDAGNTRGGSYRSWTACQPCFYLVDGPRVGYLDAPVQDELLGIGPNRRNIYGQ